jgi:hypothetical protein
MDQPTPATLTPEIDTADALAAEPVTEAKPDALSMLAVDANALAHAIAAGRGHDLSRLINDLIKSRAAA